MLYKKNSNYQLSVNRIYLALLMGMFIFSTACNSGHTESEQSESGHEKSESSHSEEGEESNTQYSKTDKFEGVRKGVHMVLAYDAETESFKGTVKNVLETMIQKVRVEVHLSNSVELGPTTAIDLEPGDSHEVVLSAKGQEFETWSTHAESGSHEHGHNHEEGGEHSHGEEGGHEHGGDGGHEHN